MPHPALVEEGTSRGRFQSCWTRPIIRKPISVRIVNELKWVRCCRNAREYNYDLVIRYWELWRVLPDGVPEQWEDRVCYRLERNYYQERVTYLMTCLHTSDYALDVGTHQCQ
jgi:hypothetical protein